MRAGEHARAARGQDGDGPSFLLRAPARSVSRLARRRSSPSSRMLACPADTRRAGQIRRTPGCRRGFERHSPVVTQEDRTSRMLTSSAYPQLAELYANLVGKKVTLQAVYDLAQRITAKYGGDGYVLSRAIVPVQQLDPNGAVVKIQVVEGYIERVEWPPELSTYRDFFSYYAGRIAAERPVSWRRRSTRIRTFG